MLKNYITTAFRGFWRNKSFTAINMLGLAVGISASLVIYLMVHYEFSFDKFEKDGDRIVFCLPRENDWVVEMSGILSEEPSW